MRRADIKALPSLEVLRHLFVYEPETGVLRWRIRPNLQARRIHPGMPAGTVGQKHGYLTVGIGRSYFLAHRIIWKMQTGADPVDQVDHKDTDRLNNRWDNLREASNAENQRNVGRQKNNKSGVKGVCWSESHKAWSAYITAERQKRELGRFKNFDEAVATRRRAEAAIHGDFARSA